MSQNSGPLTIGGALLGAFIGFATQRTTILAGKLPFMVVMTRGSNLQGFDQMLQRAAEDAFDHMLMYAVIGAVVGFGISKLGKATPAAPTETPPKSEPAKSSGWNPPPGTV